MWWEDILGIQGASVGEPLRTAKGVRKRADSGEEREIPEGAMYGGGKGGGSESSPLHAHPQ